MFQPGVRSQGGCGLVREMENRGQAGWGQDGGTGLADGVGCRGLSPDPATEPVWGKGGGAESSCLNPELRWLLCSIGLKPAPSRECSGIMGTLLDVPRNSITASPRALTISIGRHSSLGTD